MLGLQDKTAVVTGAGSGIGRAIGLNLASAGVNVVVTDIDINAANETAALVQYEGGKAIALKHEVSDEDQWIDVIRSTRESFGQLNMLVNNAGIFQRSETFSTPVSVFQQVMAVNAQGTFLGMKHGIPLIAAAGGGAVVNISSMCGIIGVAQSAIYCASKGAIRLMSKAVALECAELKNRVRVNSVHPGLVDTPSFAKVGNAAEYARTIVPIGVPCAPEEVAGLVQFLCSDGGKHITGTELIIDGGMTAQ